MAEEHEDWSERLTEAYHRMLERVRGHLFELEHDAGPALQRAVDEAREKASELGELSREEAQRVGDYLQHDLEDAAHYLGRTGRELAGWLQFDAELVERGLIQLFTDAVDKTRIELGRFSNQAAAFGEWHAGEITAFGTLQCKSCGEVIHLHGPKRIPPCPRCHGTTYRRLSEEE